MCCDRIHNNDNNSNSMKTRSKVKSVQASGTWNGKDGTTFYRFDYVMEDDTSIQASHISEAHFKVGDEVDYEVTRTHETYGKSGKVGKPSDFQQKKEVDWDKREQGIKVGHAINNAVQMVISGYYKEGSTDEERIKNGARMIYRISAELNQEL
ncbi:MAG: hypothetical protein GY928_24380 [Colwellia sp.]|nr:hypothetical protein [Colwellia sp.]